MADKTAQLHPPGFTREEWLEIAWSKNPPDISDEARKVLVEYSKVPSDEVLEHVTKVREKGFSIWPYPCIGQWRFLSLALGRHSRYQEVLQRMLTGEQNFLDLGCAFAQDVRRLVADGVDSSKCFGSDLRLEFVDLGYELFRDKETLKAKFIEADVFVDDSDLSQLHGKIDIINASSFFHLFSSEDQMRVARRCMKLWTSKPGNLLIGKHVGNEEAGQATIRGGSMVYRHSVDSWKRMWSEIADETGLKFKVDAVLSDHPSNMPNTGLIYGRPEGTKIMTYGVELIE